ncbi:MAG: hypothetical protein ACKOPT_04600 [Cyanobium sp.]
MPQTSNPYAQLWQLGGGKTHHHPFRPKELPQAAGLMRKLELDVLEADSSVDRQLHHLMELHEEDDGDCSFLACLCLRCRASGVAAWHLRDLVANYHNLSRSALQPEVEELASFILDDEGKLDPDGGGARQPYEPFLLWTVRRWDPHRGALPAWVKTAINGHNGLKKLEAHYGICRISTWAALAHRVSEKAIRDHWSFLGDGDMKPEQAISLLRDYQQHYPQAIQAYRDRTRHRNGWLPGEDFLLQVNPYADWETTRDNLKAIAKFWRKLTFGPKQTSLEGLIANREAFAPEPEQGITNADPPLSMPNQATGEGSSAPSGGAGGAGGKPPASPQDGSGSDEATPDLLQLLASEEEARLVLAQVTTVRRTLLNSITFPPSYKPLRQRLRANGERLLCACRGQAEGRRFPNEEGDRAEGQRNQRQIANECGCSQPTIQRDLQLLETWAEEIAVEAVELLRTTPGFTSVGTSAQTTDLAIAALRRLLLVPLHYGEEALLCEAIDQHLQTP